MRRNEGPPELGELAQTELESGRPRETCLLLLFLGPLGGDPAGRSFGWL